MKLFNVICGLNLGLLSLFSFVEPVQSITLKLLPQTQNVTVGDSVIVDIQISELGEMESPSVGGFDLDFNYEPAILTFNSATFSGLIDLSGLTDDEDKVDNSMSGLVTLVDLSFDAATALNAAQPSSFNLVTLNLTASGVGDNSDLSLTIVELIDEMFLNFASVEVENATISVEPLTVRVSEPSFKLISWIVFLGLTSICCKKLNA